MALPVTIPNTFANATTSIPLSQLDTNFSTLSNAINGINSGAETLANLKASNVTITGGVISNVTLDNVTVDVETLSNVTINGGNVTVTNMVASTANANTINVTTINARDGTASISLANTTGIATFSKATVIETTDNTNAALRITQLGSGNALLVEDTTNPDASPVVIDAEGRLVVGYTTVVATQNFGGVSVSPALQTHGAGQSASSNSLFNWSSSGSNLPSFIFNKSIGGTVGTRGALTATGTSIGAISFNGDDGTNFLPAAAITAFVDGTPGTNDMPGRLLFYTTADGAATPTERMRIDSAGQVGIGTTPVAGQSLNVAKNITGSTTAMGIRSNGQIQTDVTSQARLFDSSPTFAAGAFSLSDLRHYYANQGSIGGATVTNQVGYYVESNLTGATNNYGFVSSIASGTNRWNFYAGGTANNYFAGQVQLGAGTVSAPALSTTGDTNTGIFFPAADTIAFGEGGAEAARIDSNGNLCVGATSSGGHRLWVELSGGAPLGVNRITDGNLVVFYESGTLEGTISVSGTTVSYNGGHLSRWAQMPGTKDDTLVKGTVMSNLDEMNVYIAPTTYWTEEDELPEGVNVGDVKAETHAVDNEQLNKVKVSDVEGDVNVAGVFVNWDYDDAHQVDEINMAMTGDMIIRIAQGVVVQKGDLLMSAGDGTAKPQGDDIVRSKTVAKVTSNHVTCTYADGSYCVPCVLMAC